MYKFNIDDWVVITNSDFRPIQGRIFERMNDSGGSNWYKILERGTGNVVTWMWDRGAGQESEVQWFPENDLSLVTHVPMEDDNPNLAFRREYY